MRLAILSLLVLLADAWQVFGQEKSVDLKASTLINLLAFEEEPLEGDWGREGGDLVAETDQIAISVLPFEILGEANYEVNFEFTRIEGDNSVGLVMPLGKTQIALEMGSWNELAHGFSRVNKLPTKDQNNPAAVQPGKLENGQRYRVQASVRTEGDSLSLNLVLDGKELLRWSGSLSEVEPNLRIRVPQSNQRFAVFTASSKTRFHTLAVKLDAPAEPASTPAGRIELTDVKWKNTYNCQPEIIRFEDEEVVSLKGIEPGVDGGIALLPGCEMGDGTIEVEIASDIFSGIAFRAADVRNFDMIYFRPQNSGTQKHANTVQYVSVGQSDADWRTLRDNFPGKYEAGADLKKDEWFHVRIVLKDKMATAYVDGRPEPVLVVDEILSGREFGSIGIWGWDTRFRKFSFTRE